MGKISLRKRTETMPVPAIRGIRDKAVSDQFGAVKSVLDVWQGNGKNADPLDRVMTFRDAYEAGVVNVVINNQSYSFSGTNSTGVTSTTPTTSTATPPTPTNLSASAGFVTIHLQWDDPSAMYSNHAYTEIWRSATNDIGTAVLAGTTTAYLYPDDVGFTNTGYYYWIRFVSTSDVEGPFNAGAAAGTFASTGYVGTSDITDLSITAAKIADGSVDLGGAKITGLLADTNLAQITDSTKIADGLIGNAKLAAGAVTATKIADGEIDLGGTKITGLLANANLTQITDATKIADSLISNSKLANNAVDFDKLAVSFSANLAYNTELLANSDGWRTYTFTVPNSTFSRNSSSDWILSGSGTGYIYQSDDSSTGVSDVGQGESSFPYTSTVSANQWYQASIYTGVHRCEGTIGIAFYTYDGTFISVHIGTTNNEKTGGKYISGYKRVFVVAQAPSNAECALVFVRKYPTTQGLGYPNSYLFFTRLHFGEAVPNQTEPSPWTPSGVTYIDGAVIKDATIGTAAIQSAAITTALIANAAVGSAQIADAAITNAKIDTAAVGTANIATAAITTALIANAAVGSAQIADASITSAKIGIAAVGTAAIHDLAVTNAKVNDIAADKITSGTITATISIISPTITGGTFNVSSSGHIRSGQTAYNTGTGFWLGNASGTPKFSIGNSAGTHMTWNGSDLAVVGGSINGSTITGGTVQTASSGKRIVLSSSSNEAEFYGDRGDGTVEKLAAIGINSNGTDFVIGYFGSTLSQRVAVYGRSNTNVGVYGFSSSDYGVEGGSSTSYGVYGSSGTSHGVTGYATNNSQGGVYGIAASNAIGVIAETTGTARGAFQIVPKANTTDPSSGSAGEFCVLSNSNIRFHDGAGWYGIPHASSTFTEALDGYALGSNSTYLLSAGFWNICASASTLTFQVYVGGAWNGVGSFGFWSDGTNMRVKNAGVSTIYLYAQKIA